MPQCFRKSSAAEVPECVYMWERVKYETKMLWIKMKSNVIIMGYFVLSFLNSFTLADAFWQLLRLLPKNIQLYSRINPILDIFNQMFQSRLSQIYCMWEKVYRYNLRKSKIYYITFEKSCLLKTINISTNPFS